MTSTRPNPAFWTGRRVLVTGHTGFKGAWLCVLLDYLGARVSGLALPPVPNGGFAAMQPPVEGESADVRDATAVANAVRRARPEIVLHLAAQALVSVGYSHPLETVSTNVMGTANLLEALRATPVAVALVVTSDKVYRVDTGATAFSEDDPLGGTDPYSTSKVAMELVVASWRERLQATGCRMATARAGNVIGGGDLAAERLVPDVLRAHRAGETLMLRRPGSVRPWQYVLDVLAGYLLFVEALFRGDAPATLNFGPDAASATTAAELAAQMQRALGTTIDWQQGGVSFDETAMLRLDADRALRTLGWRTTTELDRAVAWIAAWHQAAWRGEDMQRVGRAQIDAWLAA
jgi:CDP-glucose 4,6-dehydratase